MEIQLPIQLQYTSELPEQTGLHACLPDLGQQISFVILKNSINLASRFMDVSETGEAKHADGDSEFFN